MRISKSCPCSKECKERNAICHSTCQKYKRWKFLQQIEINQYNKQREIDHAVNEIIVDGATKSSCPESLKHRRKKNGH